MRASSRFQFGFSIVELVVSVAILGILAAVAMPVIQTSVTREKEYQLQIALRDIRNAIDAYKQASVSQLITADSTSGYPHSLADLAAGVPTNANPPQQIYFLRSVPRDPFFPDETTSAIDTWNVRTFTMNPGTFTSSSQATDVFDVSSMSTQAGLNGVPYNEW
jgi:general secretion pathway protein G